MGLSEISGIDQGYKLLRGSWEAEGSAENSGKQNGEKTTRCMGFLPGFFPTSKIRKANDSNLSPFHICNSKTIQYGDTSLPSICTDDPKWSAGECKLLSKYEGRFMRKPYLMSSKVKIYCFEYYYLSCHLLGSKKDKRNKR